MSTITLPASTALAQVTIKIRMTGQRTMATRLRVATYLFKFAGWVAGTNTQIEIGGEFDELQPRRRTYTKVGDLVIPCQASVREGSPFYASNVFDWSRKVDLYLDGVKQDRVVSYDMDTGFMRVLDTDAKGEPFVRDDEVATIVLRGKVEARLR